MAADLIGNGAFLFFLAASSYRHNVLSRYILIERRRGEMNTNVYHVGLVTLVCDIDFRFQCGSPISSLTIAPKKNGFLETFRCFFFFCLCRTAIINQCVPPVRLRKPIRLIRSSPFTAAPCSLHRRLGARTQRRSRSTAKTERIQWDNDRITASRRSFTHETSSNFRETC